MAKGFYTKKQIHTDGTELIGDLLEVASLRSQ
jgi:hypothetical protein